MIIDESHNLRNREGKRYKAIKDYIEKNESKCILLTATPYNKTYLDISSQLRLFLSDEACRNLGIRPEKLLAELGEAKFNSRYQCPVRSLMAFEQSEHADDWRELMRHYLVRRTRSFIQENYARTDLATGRKYLEFSDGTRSYFPVRTPKTVRFLLNSEQQAQDDPYTLLYSDRVVTTINELNLPRYGLANYIVTKPKTIGGEAQILSSLSRGGKRLMGFCRTNLFKRLESGGPAFIQSLERHVLRNFVFLYAILPADGIERLIRLRERVRERLKENAEVVGTDEAFFEDDMDTQTIHDIYNERSGILDAETDTEIDLASQAYQIWKNATDADPKLKGIIEKQPHVVFSTRAHQNSATAPEGVLVYMRTSDGNDSLAWINHKGESVTQSQLAILRAAACNSREPAITRPPEQHDLVLKGVEHIIAGETHDLGGQLGSRSGARLRTYERLRHISDTRKNTLFPPPPELDKLIDEIYHYPLQETAKDTLSRQLRSEISDDDLIDLVLRLRDENRLCHIQEQTQQQEPHIICSLGLFELAE